MVRAGPLDVQRAWIGSERPTLLFDLATKRLVDKKVVLPGVTVLERLVSGSRERAEKLLWATLAAAPTEEQAAGLQGLVVVPAGKRLSVGIRYVLLCYVTLATWSLEVIRALRSASRPSKLRPRRPFAPCLAPRFRLVYGRHGNAQLVK